MPFQPVVSGAQAARPEAGYGDLSWSDRLLPTAIGGGLGFLMGGPVGAAIGAGLGGASTFETFQPVFTLLDTAARPVRTLLGTGDVARAGASIFDPEQALDVEQLKQAWGIPQFNQGKGFDIGDVGDFALSFATGVFTDPMTLVGAGMMTKAGAATKTLGQSFARGMMAGEKTLGSVDDIRKLTMEWNRGAEAVEAAQRLKVGSIRRLNGLREGAGTEEIETAAQGIKDFFTHFGLGKTFRERLSHGQQSLFGIGNPLKSTMAPVLGGEGALLNEAADLVKLRDFGSWLADTSDIVGAAAKHTYLGRRVSEVGAKAREFFFNPNYADALDELQRAAPTMQADRIRGLENKVRDYSQVMEKAGIRGNEDYEKAVIEIAQYRNVASGSGAEIYKRRMDWLENESRAGRLSNDQRVAIHTAAENFRSIDEEVLATAQELGLTTAEGKPWSRLGDEQRETVTLLEGQLATLKDDFNQRLQYEANINQARLQMQSARDGVIRHEETRMLNEAGEYAERKAAIENWQKVRDARKAQTARMYTEGFMAPDEAHRAVEGLDRAAAAWAREHYPADEWMAHAGEFYSKVAPSFGDADLRNLAGITGEIATPPVKEMTTEAVRHVAKSHQLTGLGNRRALDEAPELPFKVYIDADGLKAVNDFAGEAGGDELLRTLANAARETDSIFYHTGGDEFKAQFATQEQADKVAQQLESILGGKKLKFTGRDGKEYVYEGMGFSYGVGEDWNAAEAAMKAAKKDREAKGLRAARGVPKGLKRADGTPVIFKERASDLDASVQGLEGYAEPEIQRRTQEAIAKEKAARLDVADLSEAEIKRRAKAARGQRTSLDKEIGEGATRADLIEGSKAEITDEGLTTTSEVARPVGEYGTQSLDDVRQARELKAEADRIVAEAVAGGKQKAIDEAFVKAERMQSRASELDPEDLASLPDEELAARFGGGDSDMAARIESGEFMEVKGKGRGGKREGAGRKKGSKAKPEDVPSEAPKSPQLIQEELGREGRTLRRMLQPEDQQVIANWLTKNGAALPEGKWLKDTSDVSAGGMAAESEVVFEEAWLRHRAGQTDPELAPIFERMDRMMDSMTGGGPWAGPAKFQLGDQPKAKANPFKKHPRMVDYDKEGIHAPWTMTLEEFGTLATKHGKNVLPDTASVEKAHLQSVKYALNNGYSVRSEVLDAHMTDPGYARMVAKNTKNFTRLDLRKSVSHKDYLASLETEWRAARRALRDHGKTADAATVEAMEKTVEVARKLADQIPEHAQLYVSEEGARALVKLKALSQGKISTAAIQRKFNELGVPLGPTEINQMLHSDPEKLARVIATGGTAPEKDLSISQIHSALWPDETTLKAISKGTGKSLDEVRKMPAPERLKAVSKMYGKLFDERPDVLLAANVQTLAKSATSHDMVEGIKNLFGRKMSKQQIVDKATAESIEKIHKDIEKLRRSKGIFDSTTKAKLKELREQLATTGHAVPEGWVHAAAISPKLQGYMVKREVFERSVKALDAMSDPAWMKGFVQSVARGVTWWKRAQLAWPGSVIRDWIGNMSLRFQNDGFHAQTLADTGSLVKVMGSNGNLDDLAKLNTKTARMPDGKQKQYAFAFKQLNGETSYMTGEEFWRHAQKEGIFHHDIVSEELRSGLTAELSQGKVSKTLDKAVKSKLSPEYWRKATNDYERLSMFHSRLSKGDSVPAAAANVDNALYNYAHVSPFVNMSRKLGVFPFATWMSKNVPRQLELLVTKPGQFTALLHAKRAVEEGVPGVAEDQLPEYLRDKLNITFGRDTEGNLWFRTLTGIIPAADVPLVTNPSEFMVEALGPIPQALYEQGTNFDSFSRRSIEDWDGQLDVMNVGPAEITVRGRTKHLAETIVGRPLTVMDKFSKMFEEDSGGYFASGAVQSAFTGVSPQLRTPAQITRDLGFEQADLERKIRHAESRARRWRERGYPDLAAADMAAAKRFMAERRRLLIRAGTERQR